MTTQAGESEVAAAKKGPSNGIVFRDGQWVTLCGAREQPLGRYVDKSGAQIVPVKENEGNKND
jgi:hypothetical protein